MPTRQELLISFPLGGLNESRGYEAQPEGSCADCQNVRPFGPSTGRARGGQRSGIVKYNSSQISGTNRVQDIIHVANASTASAELTAMNVRTFTGVAVSDGDVRTFGSGSSVSTPTNGNNALSDTAPVIFSAVLFGEVFFADGVNAKYYDPSSDTVATWTPTAGSLPINGSDRPRLIELWRGRIVQSGIASDPHNWFMSRKDDAFDWNYAPGTLTTQDAVAGNNAPAGKVGDYITSIIPYNDDILIFGCDHSIWAMTGDPADGGRLDLISDVTGISWGRPWCKDPAGTIYFFGSRGGVFRMRPGQVPERMTANRIDERLADIDLDAYIVRLAWNDREQGLYVFVTSLTGLSSTNYFWDSRTDSWWADVFADADFQPAAVHLYDGDEPNDRAILLGGQDGYIRQIYHDAKNDDGQAIDSYVAIGPIHFLLDDGGGHPPECFLLKEVSAVLAEFSDDVALTISVGNSDQQAFDAVAEASFHLPFTQEDGGLILLDGTGSTQLHPSLTANCTFGGGRSNICHPRLRGYGAYLKLSNSTLGEGWEMESVRVAAEIKSGRKRIFR